jgi:pimeloyl-ACP methyl ester carboxylesterase
MPLALRTVRATNRVLAAVAPGVAVRGAAAMFFRPRRFSTRPPAVPGLRATRLDIDVAGRRVAAWSWGDGPVVLLAHGWEGHAGQFSPFVAPILARGLRAVAIDMPAHGRSAGRATNMVDFARTIRLVAAAVGGAHAVVGHSLGGAATALALADGLPARRAALIAPAAHPDYFVRAFGAIVGLPARLRERLLARLRAELGELWAQAQVPTRVRALSVPALLLHDPADSDVPFEHAVEIAAAWPGSRLEPVEGLGHRRILKDAGVVERVVEFVADC